jgi:aminopeptidase N
MSNKYFLLILLIIPLIGWSQYSEPDQFKAKYRVERKSVNETFSNLLNQYDQKFVFIDIFANDSNVNIGGFIKYDLLAKSLIIDTVYFEFTTNFIVDSIQINSQNSAFYYSNDTILVFPTIAIAQGDLFSAQIWYHRIPGAPVNWNAGLKNTHDAAYNQSITWTLSESFHLKDWIPCKQDLTDRLDSAWIFVTVDSVLKVGSNGKLTNVTQIGNGKLRYEWKEHHPIVYYLLSIAVGEYKEYNVYAHPTNYSDSILIQNYIYKDPQFLINNTWNIMQMAPMFELYCDKFGPYPWPDEKFGHALCPVGGGMEHQTMTSLGYLDTWLVAHELTHQWFGDHITCASWQDIWVNEGFASYGEYIFGQYTNGQIAADINMNYCHIKAKLEPFRSVYIPFSEAWDEGRIFNGNLSYKKGSAIIHMLRYLCNTDSLFFVALKQMQSQYADSVLTGEDVKNVFESVNGKSFDDFFNQYYYGEGFPIYKIVWQQDSSVMGFSDLKVKLEHHGSSANNSLFTIPVELKIKTSTDSLITAINPTQNVQTFNINMNNKKVTEIVFDPKNWVLDSLLSITQEIISTEIDDFFINIFPNPATENLYFKYSGPDGFKGNLKLLDLSGREVFDFIINSKEETISLKKVTPGIYIAEIHGNHVNIARKTVVVN